MKAYLPIFIASIAISFSLGCQKTSADYAVLQDYPTRELEKESPQEGQVYLLLPRHSCPYCQKEIAGLLSTALSNCDRLRVVISNAQQFTASRQVIIDRESLRLESLPLGTAHNAVMIRVKSKQRLEKLDITAQNIPAIKELLNAHCGSDTLKSGS